MAERGELTGRPKDQQGPDHVLVDGRVRRADFALSGKWKEPQTDAERKLAAIWQDVFDIDVVGISDDFFELGGDSFAATTLAAEIEATFGVRFTPSDIINLSTVAQQAKMVAQASAAPSLPTCLILGRKGGPKPPLFMVHGGKGFAFFKPAFLDIVGEERSVYLFQAPGLDGRTPLESIEDITVERIAAIYAEAIQSIQPSGPFHIAAICAGSFIALEICMQLEKAGHAIGRLVLLDPTPMPPRIKPSEIKTKEERKRAKRSKSKLGALLDVFTYWRRGEAKTGEPEPWQMPPKKLELQRELIKRRVEQMGDVVAGDRSYTAERMFKISQQFRAALYKHVPRPYPGEAAMLVSSVRAKETLADTAFWPNNLGNMQYEVLGTDHSDVFNESLVETATFVKDALNGRAAKPASAHTGGRAAR